MREYAINASGDRLRFHDLPGTGLPVLFIHGIGCASSFDYPEVACLDRLPAHRRILADLPGYGYSDKPAGFDYSVDGLATVLVDLVEHLGLERLFIFGHSMGGAVAICLARRLGGRVAGLAISEGNLDPGGGPTSRRIAEQPLAGYVAHGHAELVAENRGLGNAAWAMTLELASPEAAHAAADSLVRGGNPGWRELLYDFAFPKTYIVGTKSLMHIDVDELRRNGVHIEMVERAGHNMARENPAGLAAAIARALALE
jgi:pimeloyl-ACP methyl ester carboxylesterase